MIKNLRRKFIVISMLSMVVVLSVIMGIVNTMNYRRIMEQADRLTSILAENDGVFEEQFMEPQKPMDLNNQDEKHPPMEMSPETPFSTRFFSVKYNGEGSVEKCDIAKIAAVDKEKATAYADTVLDSGKQVGFQDVYRYRVIDTDDGKLVIFVDCRQSLENFQHFTKISISVAAIGLFAVFILVFFFSKIVFRPVQETYEKQKRFITDASHELKTPLTIIDANTEVIEMEAGSNKWTESTKNQVERLSALTEQLVMLSRFDEEQRVVEKKVFSLSEAVADAAEPFVAMAKTKEKDMIFDIDENVLLNGNEKDIRQLVGILLENAVKYSSDKGSIKLTLHGTGKKILFSVENSVEEIKKGNLDILFERFYRLDSSRNSQTGGSGIGLSIAKAIVQRHKGKISAFSNDGKSLTVLTEFKK
ncbi:MAG: HAMP domain-containing histidine kinase [Eubacterium sp.]|nr:HAMP domain-containing histidine kinase [Eubacterium sp.]